MNDVIKSGNIIKKIRDGKQLEEIALFARNCIFRDGPKDTLVLEILSYLKLFQPTFFEKFEDELIETMGLFFKNPSPDTLQGVVFDMYRQHIKEKYGEDYTPMQASILEQIEDKHHFSFSAPTSTGSIKYGCQNYDLEDIRKDFSSHLSIPLCLCISYYGATAIIPKR